jgi:methylmalonyl-CoA mutase N-terminal domain/subunit
VQNDILKEYVARGTYIFPPEPSLRLVVDVMDYCSQHVPNWNTISISGYHIREAGSTAVQELAFTFADAIAYVEAAVARGLKVDDFAPRIAFFWNSHSDFFEEVAKFRAARRIWARIMRDRFGAKDPRSMMLRFHTQTAGSMLTAQQPDNNIVRVALQALAAVLGGTQSLHCNGRDEALSLPSEEAARIALRTQQILAAESGVANTADPVGGSYVIESMTDVLEREAIAILDRIEAIGGTLSAIEHGWIQREIQDAAYRTQQAVDDGQLIVVGVNRFADHGASAPPVASDAGPSSGIFGVDPDVERRQIERVRQVRASRSHEAWRKALLGVADTAREGGNLVPPIVTAVEAYATVGEIADTLRDVFGEFSESAAL